MDIEKFQQRVLAYYSEHKRDLPWRRTTDPYHILLSEIMLQQTQVSRGRVYYERWTSIWPAVGSLANADRRQVLSEWIGLGYNKRAVNLHLAAQKIMSDYDGDVISAMKDYRNIPGVGPYTAAAVRIFSTNEDIVTVDTNIRRILMHEFSLHDSSDNDLWDLAQRCLPKGKSRDWHNALMDYGSFILTSRKTGIKPKTTQKAFIGSDRQVRSRILKELIAQDLTPRALQGRIGDDRVGRLLDAMMQEGIIMRKGNTYTVSDAL